MDKCPFYDKKYPLSVLSLVVTLSIYGCTQVPKQEKEQCQGPQLIEGASVPEEVNQLLLNDFGIEQDELADLYSGWNAYQTDLNDDGKYDYIVSPVICGSIVLPQLVMENASVKLVTIAWRCDYGKGSEKFFGGGEGPGAQAAPG